MLYFKISNEIRVDSSDCTFCYIILHLKSHYQLRFPFYSYTGNYILKMNYGKRCYLTNFTLHIVRFDSVSISSTFHLNAIEEAFAILSKEMYYLTGDTLYINISKNFNKNITVASELNFLFVARDIMIFFVTAISYPKKTELAEVFKNNFVNFKIIIEVAQTGC